MALDDARGARQVVGEHRLLRVATVGDCRGAVSSSSQADDVVDELAHVHELAQGPHQEAAGGELGRPFEELTGPGDRAVMPLEHPQGEQDMGSRFRTEC